MPRTFHPRSGALRVCALVVLLSAASMVAVADVQVNDPGASEPYWQNETTIVEFDYDDPADTPDAGSQDVILVGFNDFNPLTNCSGGFCFPRTGLGRSLAGAPFVHSGLPTAGLAASPAGTISRGDPVLAVDQHAALDGLGNPLILLAHMATPSPSIGPRQVLMFLSSSADGGRTFPSASAMRLSNPPAGSSDDKPWIAVDQRGGARPPDGNAYVCWTRVAKDAAGNILSSQILLSQIPPGGPPGPEIAVTTARAFPRFVQSCQVAVDTLGNIYVSWTDFLNDATNTPNLMIRHAPPPAGANTLVFDPPSLIAQLRGGNFGIPGGVVNCLAPNWLPQGSRGPFLYDFVMNAASLATDAISGRIYAAWSMWNGPSTVNGAPRFDVFVKSATSPGLTTLWNRAQVVHHDGATATDQFMPSIAVWPRPVYPVPIGAETAIDIGWTDKRNSGAANNAFEIFGGESPFSADTLLSGAGPEPINPAGANLNCRIGDYNAVTGADIRVGTPDGGGPGAYFLHAWGDTRGAGANTSEIFFASESFTPKGIIEIPPILADLSMFALDPGVLGLQLPVHAPYPVPLHIGIANLSQTDVDAADTWIGVSAPPGVRLSLLGDPQADACFGPAPTETEGPEVAVLGVPCDQGPIVALGAEDSIPAAFQYSLDRSLEVTCEEEGTFDIKVFAGTGPVLPIEVEEGDASDNAMEASIQVFCLPDLHPPAPGGVEWTTQAKMQWDPVAGTDTYRIHRGESGTAPWMVTPALDSCLRLETAVTDTGETLTEAPAPASLFWYQVTAVAGGLESLDPPRSIDDAGSCGLCPHDICSTGGVLSTACGDCASTVCGLDSYCCATAWDDVCVQEVRTLCGGARCRESAGACAHSLCRTAASPLTASCDVPPLGTSCVDAICAADAFCCGTAWDAICAGEVTSICGLGCF